MTIQQDWLGFIPFFYNSITGKSSININEVIDYSHIEFDPEGLLLYLKFGYSVFGKTPIKGVHFLRQNQSLFLLEDGGLDVLNHQDICLNYLESVTAETTAWDILNGSVIDIAGEINGRDVLIPTSGGFDSRLLNYFYPSKDKIWAFTYGISNNQEDSFETVHAKEVCKKLGVRWERVNLGQFHDYLEVWNDLYGTSTHAHGMYHWEFYSTIRERYGVMPMLSGIAGDLWAGSPTTFAPEKPEDLIRLGYSHGLVADANQCLLKCNNEILEAEFERERNNLQSERYRVLYLVRTKMILLSYLMAVPKALGFKPQSPFVDRNVAMAMLTVEPSRWRGRVWQKEFMVKHGLDVEHSGIKKTYRNDLDFNAMRIVPLRPLNTKLLSRLFKREYLEWINRAIRVESPMTHLNHWILGIPKIGGLLKRLGASDSALAAYSAYIVLRPLEQVLLRSEQLKGTR